MKKFFLIAVIVSCFGAIIAFSTSAIRQELLPVQEVHDSRTQEAVAADQAKSFEEPVTLTIPKLGIDARVESVGMDSTGKMDVPKNADNVAWYNLGYKPGEIGSAVIAGHFDKVTGEPAVFYNLEKLQIGDQIIITDSSGNRLTFAVVRFASYSDSNFPLQEVFGEAQQPRLNLITCDGSWNSAAKSYSHRTVVYAEIVE